MDKDLPYIYCLTILLVILVALTGSGKCEDECQPTNSSAAVVRHFYHHHISNGADCYAEHSITIAHTPYNDQLRLINWYVKTLLMKKLGYHLVAFDNDPGEKSFNRGHSPIPSNCTARDSDDSTKLKGWPPAAMISIQSSSTPLSDDFKDAGRLGITMSYGVFVSDPAIDKLQCSSAYEDLRKPEVIQSFSQHNQEINKELENYKELHDLKCANTSLCFKYIYSSPTCQNTTCAILLLGDTDYPIEDLWTTIATLNLSLQVQYVGQHITDVVTILSDNNTPFMTFLSSTDAIITSHLSGRLSRVRSLEPSCSFCHFPQAELRKVIWRSLVTSEPLIYELIKNIQFSNEEVTDMYGRYISSGDSMEDFTAQLVSENSTRIKQWVPEAAKQKPKLYIGGMFPLHEDGAWREPSLVPAARMAIELINNDTDILCEYDLTLMENDTSCDSSWVLEIFTEYVRDDNIWNKMVGGLGPACSDTAVIAAGVASLYNYVMISYAAEAMALSLNRERHKYFYRTVPQVNDYAEVYVALFKELAWTDNKVSMLTDDKHGEYAIYHDIMSRVFEEKGIKLAARIILPSQQYLEKQVAEDLNEAYSKYLDRIKETNSHIIIMDVFMRTAPLIMCQAYKKGMTMKQGYQWFLPDSYMWDWYYDETLKIDCTMEEMTDAVRGYFTLSHSNIDKTGTIAVGGMTGTQFLTKYEDLCDRWYPSDFGSYTYDAVWTFAKALQNLYQENPAYLKYIHSDTVAERYLDAIQRTDFPGVSGRISFVNGDRSGIIELLQYNKSGVEDAYLVHTFLGNWSSTTGLWLNKSAIEWGEIPEITEPPAIRICEWEHLKTALNVSCASAFMIVVIPSCTFVILFIIAGALITLRRAKRKFKLAAEMVSKIGEERLYPMLNLDEKEIPRSNVILNRKLGEGAFGTVYGGEAFINHLWTGVAVKTLRPGSNSEEKLDFLREADIMKRFEHKNIVKLLGVTTRGEPAYAIMEFMLYGDLKTYLLSRRELVGCSDSNDTDTISASSLTRMAVDIIEGLNFLHSREYIHRDIACRNCLVSSSRTVKIGDFGMARRVYDDGCYLFTRRGKLPVRWMAPESFVDGIFTYKTDIWSFGILIYEIITFGQIPYNMLTNAEVFESIKSGDTLTLPEECTDELKSLMLDCWKADPLKRPSSIDIYGLLSRSDNIIQPVLTCPALAQINNCEESTEVDMSPAPLKASSIFKKPMLRQSSSIISVDTGTSTFSRHRNHSEVSYRRSQSAPRRRSTHSNVDLHTLLNMGASHPSPNTPMSMPSPSHSAGPTSFHFPLDVIRYAGDDAFCYEVRPTQCCHDRPNIPIAPIACTSAGSGSECNRMSTENDYLLTTRSCVDLDDDKAASYLPMLQQTDETIL